MDNDYDKHSFKNYENIPGLDITQRAIAFGKYLDYKKALGHLNYRLESVTGCGPEVMVKIPGKEQPIKCVGLVSNDYLGFTQHPAVRQAAIEAIREFGTGAGASPAIGGHFSFHQNLEKDIAGFYGRDEDSAILYTTGYTANNDTIQCLLKMEDVAILDMAVHASVYAGCQLTNTKTFLHNDLDKLERLLKECKEKYRTKMVIVDGVYSQEGDMAPLDKIVALCKQYGAYLMVDDAHGTGVIGKTGRGVIEHYNLLHKVDIISGTFSKTFGHLGGYVVASPVLIRYLKYQSRQHLFSVTATPASACISTSIGLIDKEPQWMEKLWENIGYLKKGLIGLGLNTGHTQSAIIPVKIGDPFKTADAAGLLLEAGVYANPIIYPAVARKDARIRLSVMATHTQEHLDLVLNAFAHVNKKLNISKENGS